MLNLLKSFFIETTNSPDLDKEDLLDKEGLNIDKRGLTENIPILLRSIGESYRYLDNLCRLDSDLFYEQVTIIEVDGFPYSMNKHKVLYKDEKFCDLFIYPHHHQNIYIIPQPFKTLNPEADVNIFNVIPFEDFEVDDNFEKDRGLAYYLHKIIELILLKSEVNADVDALWIADTKSTIAHLKHRYGFGDGFENLVLKEYHEVKSKIPTITKNDFIVDFI